MIEHEQYYRKGGTYELPIEIYNDLIGQIEEAQKERNNYKSRCEKAIEYIENNKKETSSHFNGKEYVYRNFTLCCEPNDLLNILNGSDEE